MTLTVDQARRARRELKLTQAALAEATGLSANSIKLFETYRYKPGAAFLDALTGFFEAQEVNFAELDGETQSDGNARVAGRPAAAGPKLARAERSCFLISDDVPQEVVDRAIDKMIDIDAAVDKLLAASVGTGFLGGLNAESEDRLREVYSLMAKGYLMFRLLQGIPPVRAVPNPEVIETISDVISQLTGADLAEVTGEHEPVTEGGNQA